MDEIKRDEVVRLQFSSPMAANSAGQTDGLKSWIIEMEQGGNVFTAARMLLDNLPQFDEFQISDLTNCWIGKQ